MATAGLALLVDLAQIVSGAGSIAAIVWAIRAHRELAVQRAQDVIVRVAASWNDASFFTSRLEVSKWIDQIPATGNPRAWADQHRPVGAWTSLAMLAHFLVSVEYLIQDGHIREQLAIRHLGGGAWWARKFARIYEQLDGETRVVVALRSLEQRYSTSVFYPKTAPKMLATQEIEKGKQQEMRETNRK